MSRVSVRVALPGHSVEAAEELWYDRARWPNFIDGFATVVSTEGGWPERGSSLVWDSRPNGRGRVVERVTEYAPGRGQTADVEDSQLRGTQSIEFAPVGGGGAQASMTLEYRLKKGGPLQAVVDLFFIRRAQGDALRRTLVRFRNELSADAELLGEG